MSKYFVFINTETERGCPKFESLDEAIVKYNSTEMATPRDNVCLGVESDVVGIGEGFCFDVVHKLYNDNILINDYLNHDEIPEVQKIINALTIRYQLTSDILKGVLIDYGTPFVSYNKEVEEKWDEAYLSTLVNKEFQIIGWVKPTRETYNNYAWNYPTTRSYVSMMNVKIIGDDGRPHFVDVDPRAYLQMLGKKASYEGGIKS